MITDAEKLQATVQAFYDALRETMIEHQTKPFPNRNRLDKTWLMTTRLARLNGITVENLPIPKSTVQMAPVISTPAAKKGKAAVSPPPPVGDVLADNAPKAKRRGRPRKTSK
jgi:hypothetical protein